MREEWRDIKDYEGLYQVSNFGNVRGINRIIVYKNGKRIKRKGKLLKKHYTKSGYQLVSLRKNNTICTKYVHILVAEAFIPNPENKPIVDHIIPVRNGGTNEVSNLRWCTQEENSNNTLTREYMENNVWNNTERNKKISEGNTGRIVSDEQKRKQSISMSGSNHPNWGKKNPEHSERMKGDKNPFYGKQHSEKTKQKISNCNSKPVYQYSLDYKLIATYKSVRYAADINNYKSSGISACARGDKNFKTYKGYIWSYTPL